MENPIPPFSEDEKPYALPADKAEIQVLEELVRDLTKRLAAEREKVALLEAEIRALKGEPEESELEPVVEKTLSSVVEFEVEPHAFPDEDTELDEDNANDFLDSPKEEVFVANELVLEIDEPQNADEDLTPVTEESSEQLQIDLPQEINFPDVPSSRPATENMNWNPFNNQKKTLSGSLNLAAQTISHANVMLPNGMVKRDYKFVFDLATMTSTYEKLAIEIEGLEAVGLNYDSQSHLISGVPTKAGDHPIKVKYRFLAHPDEGYVLTKSLVLTVNPDPRSLWKDFPSDQSDAYWKPDTRQERKVLSNGKTLVAASQRGRSHAQEGKFRDDEFELYEHPTNGWSLVCVADGAGSAKYSRRGSLIACTEIVKYFDQLAPEKYSALETAASDNSEATLRNLLYEIIGGATFKAFKAIEAEATTKNAKTKDFATTLVFSLFKQIGNQWFVANYGVGDSPAGAYTIGEAPQVFHYVEEGEYSGQTYFLTMSEIFSSGEEIMKRLSYKFIDDCTAMLWMTDGIHDPKFQTRHNLDQIPVWDALWEDLKTQVEFNPDNMNIDTQLLEWLQFWSPGNHDDRTIAILF